MERPDYESQPLSRGEYVSAMVHLYRGELDRSLNWRQRLDTTTNWSIVCTLAILTFAVNSPGHWEETVIAGMYANLVFLFHEARRFRFFDLFRARVRMIEENFYVPILRREPKSPIEDWGAGVADDLLSPRFKISLAQALRARLVRNYASIYALLLLAWFMGVFAPDAPDTPDAFERLGAGPWLPVAMVAALYLSLGAVALFTPKVRPPEAAFASDAGHRGMPVPPVDV